MRRFSSHSDSIKMFTAAEAVLRKRWRGEARTVLVCATNRRKSCRYSPVSFASSKCKARFRWDLAPEGTGHITEEASQDRKSRKRQNWHGGKNVSCDSDRGALRGRGRLKAYYMAIRGEPRAFEHQPRRQKVCERELRIRVDSEALENILFGLRSAGARVLVVHVSHQLQALSTSQSCITSR